MQTLIIGGAASGKSAFAEALALEAGAPHIYIATMRPTGAEAAARIARHQALRAGKGFATVECYDDLTALRLPPQATVLLECLGNLAANVLFAPGADAQSARAALEQGLTQLVERSAHLLVVSNDIFADGVQYAAETRAYLALLGELNAWLAARAARVVELVCGLPLWHKGAA